MIELVCLDMAGTTVRDDGAVLEAFDAALAELGFQPGSEELRAARAYALETMGQSKIEVFRALTGDEDAARQGNLAFERAYAARLAAGAATPVEGAEEAIRGLRGGGVKVAFTTGFSAETRDALITALGWDGLADLALSPSDAGRGRPYPDMVLTALIRLGVDDVRSVAVAGDTASDLLSGTRAGASIVAGVLTGAHGEAELSAAPHTHLLPSVADLPFLLAAQTA